MKCPECGKNHRLGRVLGGCRANSEFDLGHYLIRGVPETDPRMVKARIRAESFRDYERTLVRSAT
jgi:hypothetical protein